ncbi:MAG TPA: ATP-binding protein [Vicinamibacterales bacterium]|jgi:signal transduction histidine kinase
MNAWAAAAVFRRWLLAALIVLGPFAVAATAYGQTGQKRVLVLYSLRRDSQFSIIGERELPRILDAGLSRNVDYYAEFIDLARSSEPGFEAAFRDFLREKYKGMRFDLVIAMHDAAVGFISDDDDGDALFPETPVVFLTNSPVRSHRPNSTGLILDRNFAATVTFIRQLQPEVQHVFIITGAAATDKVYENVVRRQLQTLSGSGLTFHYLSGLATADLEARLSRMPERSAAYYVIVSSDPDGAMLHPLNYVDRIAAVADAPTYSWVDSTIDHGVVGGSLYNQRAAIERVGQLALRVLDGEPADSIPVVAVDLNSYEVDWRQLRRWRIDEGRVPAGTLISFRDPSPWNQYRPYILATVTLFAIQTALMAGLLIQRTRRQRAEGKLRESQNALIGSDQRNRDLAGRLLRAQETERSRIARELHDDICQRMLLLTIELESAARTDDGEGATAALMVAREISNSLRELSHQLHPARLRVIGLVSALESLCTELSHAGVAIAYTHDNVPSALPPDVMLCLFRVVQEAVQNALKYSRATELAVDIRGTPHGLTLMIFDNGVGFDVDAAWGTGVGLRSMFERLQAAGGSLNLTSRPGSGTRLVAILPRHVLQTDPDPNASA